MFLIECCSLSSQTEYKAPIDTDGEVLDDPTFLSQHLTNTCQQSTISSKTVRERKKSSLAREKDTITSGIHKIVKDLLEAGKEG